MEHPYQPPQTLRDLQQWLTDLNNISLDDIDGNKDSRAFIEEMMMNTSSKVQQFMKKQLDDALSKIKEQVQGLSVSARLEKDTIPGATHIVNALVHWRKKYDDVVAQLTDVENQLRVEQAKKPNLEHESELQQLISQLQAEGAERSELITQLQQEGAEKSELVTQLQQEGDEKSELITQLQQDGDEKSELITQLQQEGDEKSELITQFQHEGAEKSELITQLHQEGARKTIFITQLQQEGARKSNLIAQLQQEGAEKSELITQLQQEGARKSNIIARLQQEGANTDTADVACLQEQIRSLNALVKASNLQGVDLTIKQSQNDAKKDMPHKTKNEIVDDVLTYYLPTEVSLLNRVRRLEEELNLFKDQSHTRRKRRRV
jgi:chromosome segregation ATPase